MHDCFDSQAVELLRRSAATATLVIERYRQPEPEGPQLEDLEDLLRTSVRLRAHDKYRDVSSFEIKTFNPFNYLLRELCKMKSYSSNDAICLFYSQIASLWSYRK